MISSTANNPCPPTHHTRLATEEMAMAINTNPAIRPQRCSRSTRSADARGLALLRDEQPRRCVGDDAGAAEERRDDGHRDAHEDAVDAEVLGDPLPDTGDHPAVRSRRTKRGVVAVAVISLILRPEATAHNRG